MEHTSAAQNAALTRFEIFIYDRLSELDAHRNATQAIVIYGAILAQTKMLSDSRSSRTILFSVAVRRDLAPPLS